MEVLTADRSVEVTPEAAAKSADSGQVLESIFSAAVLPVDFYRDLLRGHSAKAMYLNLIILHSFPHVFIIAQTYVYSKDQATILCISP